MIVINQMWHSSNISPSFHDNIRTIFNIVRYFKINKLVKAQQKTNEYLERIARAVERNASVPNFTSGPLAQNAPVVAPAPAPQIQAAPVITAPVQPEIVAAPEATQKACAGCGVMLPADASFCTQCGTPASN